MVHIDAHGFTNLSHGGYTSQRLGPYSSHFSSYTPCHPKHAYFTHINILYYNILSIFTWHTTCTHAYNQTIMFSRQFHNHTTQA